MIAYLGLGSNLGQREANLLAALELLPGPGLEPVAVSSIYESDPVGPVQDQPSFLNLVLEARTSLLPEALLNHCLAVERRLGRDREREVPKGPRLMDVDLLLVGQQVGRWPDLVLPHPELTNRAFVVLPLLELSPDLTDPRDGSSLEVALPGLADQGIQKKGPVHIQWPGPFSFGDCP